MNWLGLIFGILIVGVIVYLMSTNKSKDKGGRTLMMHGFTKIGYNINDMNALEAERLATRLRDIAEKAWVAIRRVYGDQGILAIEHIIFDPKFEERRDDGGKVIIRKVIRLLMPEKMITMRPQGGGGHTGEYWFCLEMHNLYRGTVYGVGNIYPHENASDEEMKLWRQAQRACKEIVA